MKLGLSHHFGSFAGKKKKSRKAPFGHVAQPPQLWSLITRGTMGQLSSYSSEGNIFTTQRSMEKAAVSKDFSLCPHTPPFFPLSSLFICAAPVLLSTPGAGDCSPDYIWVRKAIHIFIACLAAGWNHLAFKIYGFSLATAATKPHNGSAERKTHLTTLLSLDCIYQRY